MLIYIVTLKTKMYLIITLAVVFCGLLFQVEHFGIGKSDHWENTEE